MRNFLSLLNQFKYYKKYLALSVLFQILTSLFTLISIPFVIPFFQLLFGLSPSSYDIPDNWWEIEKTLNYGFSRLIAISDRRNALVVVVIAIVIIFLFRNLFRFLASYYLIPARNGLIKSIRSNLFDSFTKMSLYKRNQYKKGQLLSMMSSDIAEIDHGILKAVELLFRTPLIVIGCLIFMFAINIKLSLLALLLSLIALLFIGRLSHMLKRTSHNIQYALGDLQAVTDEYIGASKLINGYNAQSFFKEKFDIQNNELLDLSNRAIRRRDLASPLSEFLAVLIIGIMLWYGAQMVFDQEILPTTFFAFIFAFYNIIDPAKSFSREYYNVQRGSAALDRIIKFQNACGESPTIDSYKDLKVPLFQDSIEFKNVSFSYPGSEKGVINCLSLKIPKNQKLGIIGASGAGKTSLVDLLMRFYHCVNGEILMDGIDVTQYRLNDYRHLFAIVTQEPQLFHMSIKENISLSHNADQERIEASLKYSLSQEFLKDRFNKNTDLLDDSGDNLSGGQKQRITIARALYHEPEVVILDEPTSNLDANTEKEVMQAITELTKDRTVITITHNARILESMDEIIIIENGGIKEKGTYKFLSKHSDTFNRLLSNS